LLVLSLTEMVTSRHLQTTSVAEFVWNQSGECGNYGLSLRDVSKFSTAGSLSPHFREFPAWEGVIRPTAVQRKLSKSQRIESV
jgi:hypothetical protein